MFGAILGSAIGALTQNSASKNADKLSREALAQQKAQNERVWSAVDPYMKTGGEALNRLNNPGENFTTSPGYEFRLKQGLDAVGTNQAVNGLLRSGGAMKALSDYGQGMASDEYNRWWGQQSGLAGMGLQGAGIGAGVASSNNAAIATDATNRANSGFVRSNAWGDLAGSIGGLIDGRSSFKKG